ncbi:MAG: pyridoxine 5'-phosphate synthase [Muribaculaceae bacterium]|nr:pyridoxine 5'-phosphate synthase [Muribaculaceae bacterium]
MTCGNVADVVQFAIDCERFGANGITVHPRPDERHIRRDDVIKLRPVITTEFNIEGYPSDEFVKLVLLVKPAQVTLVPDLPAQLTSNHGWDVIGHEEFLSGIIDKFHEAGIRTSIFVDPDADIIKAAASTGTDRVELYTEPYASNFEKNPELAVAPYIEASKVAHSCGLGVNGGHDLNLRNLHFFANSLPYLAEVSIGHALISDALYMGIENTVKAYKAALVRDKK